MVGFQNRQLSISTIRFIALCMIIVCHITQYYNLEICKWFNVGVQIFLCISGFLFSNREIDNIPKFLNKRFQKVLVPYYIVFILYGIIYFFFARDLFSFDRFLGGIILKKRLAGAGHLWFVATILICYVHTVFLDAYRRKYVVSRKTYLLYTGMTCVVTAISFFYFFTHYTAAWIVCYVIGYCIGINEKEGYVSSRKVAILFFIFAVIGNGIQIYCDYIGHVEIPEFLTRSILSFRNYNHVWLGISLFLGMKLIFDRLRVFDKQRVLSVLDNYSYEVYLVHQLIILGPFTMMKITSRAWLNIVLILLSIALLAYFLKRLEMLAFKLIDRKWKAEAV